MLSCVTHLKQFTILLCITKINSQIELYSQNYGYIGYKLLFGLQVLERYGVEPVTNVILPKKGKLHRLQRLHSVTVKLQNKRSIYKVCN
jgi:hypothetical protein